MSIKKENNRTHPKRWTEIIYNTVDTVGTKQPLCIHMWTREKRGPKEVIKYVPWKKEENAKQIWDCKHGIKNTMTDSSIKEEAWRNCKESK